MRLPLCIVGCGNYAKTVLNDIHDMTDVLELYFASRDINKAKEYNDRYGGAGYFGSYEEAVSDPRIQAAYFFTPHHTHLDDALLAVRNSKHILMEKPIARTADESNHMIQAARESGVKLMVAENYRFLHTVNKCKEVIAEGNIGDLRMIQVQAESRREPDEWRTSAESTGGGVFIDGGIHFVDMIVNIGGYPRRVYAAKPPQVFHKAEGEDGLVMTAHLPNGALGLINMSRATAIQNQVQWVNVTGTKGQVQFVPYGNELSVETSIVKRTVRLPLARRGVRGMVEEFRDAIAEDREPAMSGEEGLKDLEVVLAAYQSANEGREISLS